MRQSGLGQLVAVLVALTLVVAVLVGQRAWATAPPTARERRVLRCVALVESRRTWHAVSRSGWYRGAHQWSRATWAGLARRHGHPEWADMDPAKASPRVQNLMALWLLRERGLQPWPPARGRCR